MSKLTVIIAAYNAEKYIEKCLNSFLGSAEGVDVVAVNDASTDGTGKILEKFKDKIKIITLEKNCGCIARTRNVGLREAQGDYITFLDADDWYEPGAVKKIINYIDRFQPDILKYNYSRVYADGTVTKSSDGTEKFRYVQKLNFRRMVYPYFVNGIGLNSVCCAAFKRKMLSGMEFSDKFRTAEDAVFALEAYTRAQSVLFTGEYLYCYYQSGSGLTGNAVSIFHKYACNFRLGAAIIKYLPQWGMNTIGWRMRTLSRPIRITADKLKRMR